MSNNGIDLVKIEDEKLKIAVKDYLSAVYDCSKNKISKLGLKITYCDSVCGSSPNVEIDIDFDNIDYNSLNG